MPKLTVLIPAYNAEKTLHRTLASLDSQIDDNFKVIIYSDGSDDSTLEIFESYKMRSSIGCMIDYKMKNNGVGFSRERLMKMCETDYFMFLDADDVLEPSAVKFINDAISKYDSKDIIMFHFFEETPKGLKLYTQEDGLTWCHGKVYRKGFITDNAITFDPGLKTGEDSYVNSICFELGDFEIVNIPVCIWCNNPDSVTRSLEKGGAYQFILDNAKSMLYAAKFLDANGKPRSEWKFVEANLPVIRKNIEVIRRYCTKHETEVLLEIYKEFEKYRSDNGN